MNIRNLPWFRVYTEMVDDDRIRMIAFEDRWHYVALLCLKGSGLLDSDDSPEFKMRRVAVKLGLDTMALEKVIRRLAEVGLVDADTMQPTNWDKRQFASDSSTNRVKKYRESKKQEAKTQSNTDETEVKRYSNVLDTDTETDTYITLSQDRESAEQNSDESLNAPSLAHEEPKKNRANAKPSTSSGSRLPADWTLSADWLKWALSETGWSEAQVQRMADSFRDYWLSVAGAKGRKADWQATWRNWVRREQGHAQIALQSHAQKKFNPSEYALHGDLSPASSGRRC